VKHACEQHARSGGARENCERCFANHSVIARLRDRKHEVATWGVGEIPTRLYVMLDDAIKCIGDLEIQRNDMALALEGMIRLYDNRAPSDPSRTVAAARQAVQKAREAGVLS
jgi:hypothetical protein